MTQTETTRNGTGQRADVRATFIAAALAAACSLGTASAQMSGAAVTTATEQLFDSVNSSVCTISAEARDGTFVSRGSGFILKDSGLLVTNAHVVAGLQRATAKCGDDRLYIRRIVKFDQDIDLAIGEIGTVDAPGLSLATNSSVRPGSQVYMFGSPFGLEGTITPGLASGRRVIDGRTYIQISGPIGAGNSGGPVTDETGAVLGIAVASLEADNNISFAIPASAISDLPSVDLQPVQLATINYAGSAAPPAAQQAPAQPTRTVPTSNGAAFRGNAFGSACGDVAVAEYGRQRPTHPGTGPVKFQQWYGGQLELNVNLLGTPATAVFDCDERLGMTAGHYKIRENTEGVDRIARVLRSKYGSGIMQSISEVEAKARGCMFNSSFPFTPQYRRSELTSWRIDDRFHIDMLVCGGRSQTTYLFYSDPVLVANADAVEEPPADDYLPDFRESDL